MNKQSRAFIIVFVIIWLQGLIASFSTSDVSFAWNGLMLGTFAMFIIIKIDELIEKVKAGRKQK